MPGSCPGMTSGGIAHARGSVRDSTWPALFSLNLTIVIPAAAKRRPGIGEPLTLVWLSDLGSACRPSGMTMEG